VPAQGVYGRIMWIAGSAIKFTSDFRISDRYHTVQKGKLACIVQLLGRL